MAGQLEVGGAERGKSGGGKKLKRGIGDVQNVHRRRKKERVERERKEGEECHHDGMEVGRRRVAEFLPDA